MLLKEWISYLAMDKKHQIQVKWIYLTTAYIPVVVFGLTIIYLFMLIDQIEIRETSETLENLIGFGYFLIGAIIIFISTFLASLAVFIFWYCTGATKEEMLKGCYKAHKALNANSRHNRPMFSKLDKWSWEKTVKFINWFYRKAT